jgi:predicted RND superfamily exporter protein
VVTTSLALSLGFLTLMASAWQSISSFGLFVSLAILAALLATLFVLPALIFAFGHLARPGRKL